MPIAHKFSINQSVSYLVWKITEEEKQLLSHLNLNSEEKDDLDSIKLAPKRLEWLGARTALKFLIADLGQFYIYKDPFGKPHLKDSSIGISVSHANGYGAAAINLKGEIGIDIETERDQIQRIARRFLHSSEKDWADHSTERLTKIWAAKEALYKLHGRTQLIFSEQLVVSSFIDSQVCEGKIIEDNMESSYQLTYDKVHELHLCCAY